MRLALLLCLCLPAHAQDDWGEDGWGEEEGAGDFDFGGTDQVKIEVPAESSPWTSDGFFRSDWHAWTERRGPWAKARQSLDLAVRYSDETWRLVLEGHYERDLAYAFDSERYDAATLNTYEQRYINGQQFVAWSYEALDVTVGRQIVAWGEGDMFSPLDVVNPRDLREPGLADLEDLRLAVLATRLSVFLGDHRLEAMMIHESDFGLRPAPLGEFSPLRSVIASDPMAAMLLGDKSFRYQDAQDRFALDQQGYLARWVYKGAGLDIGAYGASVLDQQGVVTLPELLDILQADTVDITLDHRRYWLAGASAATSVGSVLIKGEIAGALDKAFNTGDTSGPIPIIDSSEGSTISPMVGLTYTGIADTQIGVELVKPLFLDEPEGLLFPADEPSWGLRFSHEALRQKLRLIAGATAFGWTADLGWVARCEATYALADGFRVGLGYVTFQPPSDSEEFSLLTGLDEHDRAMAKIRYDFALQ